MMQTRDGIDGFDGGLNGCNMMQMMDGMEGFDGGLNDESMHMMDGLDGFDEWCAGWMHRK
jgi:hypothetical protein